MKLTIGRSVIDLVRVAYRADRPVMLRGSHGVGKSELLKQAAAELGVDCIVIDLSLYEPMDLVGLPRVVDGRTEFAPPTHLPRDGAGLLVIEELNRAPAYVRRPCLQLLTERALNEYRLPRGWLPVACVNPGPDDGDGDGEDYDVDPLDPALESRFIVVDVVPSLKEWVAWAKAHAIHAAVVTFVQSSGVAALAGSEAQPRAWAYVSDVLKAHEAAPLDTDSVLHAMIEGLVGSTWAVSFLRTYRGTEVPLTADEILTGEATVAKRVARWKKGKRMDLLDASVEGLLRHVRTNVVAHEISSNVETRSALTAFLDVLPADQQKNAVKRINGLFQPLGAKALILTRSNGRG